MSCSDKIPEFNTGCEHNIKGSPTPMYYDSETQNVYDELKQYIGKGYWEDGILIIKQEKHNDNHRPQEGI